MKAIAGFFVFAILLVVAVAALAPATLADAELARASDGTIRIADAGGTLWRGRGMLTTADARWQVPLRWELSPLALLRGTLQATIGDASASAYAVSGAVQVEDSQLSADNLLARLPAAFADTGAPPGAIAGGEISLRAPRLVATDRGFDGNAVLHWRDARIALKGQPLLWLGTVTANLTGRGDALGGPVTARGGDVEVEGTLGLRGGRVSANLRVKPHPEAPAAVGDALSRFGAPDAGGAVALRFDQPLR